MSYLLNGMLALCCVFHLNTGSGTPGMGISLLFILVAMLAVLVPL